MKPQSLAAGRVKLYQGEALAVLRALPEASVDAMITDPPYSTGGFTRGDRMAPPASKYVQSGTVRQRPAFAGDNRDGRSWGYWTALWLAECLRVVRPGGYAMLFSDWRQLPTASDAFQAGGFLWRGIIVWDKSACARAPHKGYARHQCEYVLWGTHGQCPTATHGGPWPGCHRVTVRQSDKHHMTGKPTKLMEALVAMTPPASVILDRFAGSGTTAVACLRTGRQCVAIEREPAYAAIIRQRVASASVGERVASGEGRQPGRKAPGVSAAQ